VALHEIASCEYWTSLGTDGQSIDVYNVEELMLSAGYTPLRKRGEAAAE